MMFINSQHLIATQSFVLDGVIVDRDLAESGYSFKSSLFYTDIKAKST